MDKKYGIDGIGTKGSYHFDKTDTEMSTNHLTDKLEYNFRHAEEHLVEAKAACERLDSAGASHEAPKSLLDLLSYFQVHESSESKLKKVADRVRG